MPFKSKAQMRKFAQLVSEGKMSQETFEKWTKETSNTQSLPEKTKPTTSGAKKVQYAKIAKVLK